MARAKKTPAAKKRGPKQTKGTVIGGALYIRDAGSLEGKIVGTLEDGAVIDIIEAGEEWHKIPDGYVMAKWVKLDDGTH